MLLNKIGVAKFNSISNIHSFSPTKRITFKGKDDSFKSVPEVIFGDINPDKVNEIISTVDSESKLSSGWTSDVYKYGRYDN